MIKLNTAFFIALSFLFFSCHHPEAADGFRIEEGFTLSRVAAEPLIKDPVDLEFNERGDALVLELPGYPFEDKKSRLLVLKDTDRNGVYDSSQVFSDNLQLANSFMPYKKGVLVAAPPYLLFVRDEDQNYVVDKVDTLMGGFSTGNLQHNYNGLLLGLDNWIYAANGGNDGKPYWWGDTTTALDLRGQDFRFNPETRVLERLGESSGGYGLAMDEFGRIFETHNLTHISHLVFPERYIGERKLLTDHSLENISDHEEYGLARIYPIGEQESRVNHPEQSGYFSGSCGVTYYGGGAFGEAYNNTVWVTDVVLNLLHVDKLKTDGASFTASRMMEKRDFLASEDRSFRPVNMTVGPDGALYVVDMYRKVIEHPEWIPDEIEKTLDLNAGKDQGRFYRITKKGTTGKFDPQVFKTNEGLVISLSDNNQWIRNTAHRMLMEQAADKETTALLKKALQDNQLYKKLHAIYILAGKNLLSKEDLISIFKDESPPLLEAALLISEKFISSDEDILKKCIALLTHQDMRVRMQAALSLSTLHPASNLYTQYKKELLQGLVSAAHQPQDDWTIAALTLAAGDSAARLFFILCQAGKPNSELLASLALNSNHTTADMQTILSTISATAIPASDKRKIIQQHLKNPGAINGRELEKTIRMLEQQQDISLLPDLMALRNKLNLPPSKEFLKFSKGALQKVSDNSLPDSVRLQQLSMIEQIPYKQKADILFECLKNNQPLKIQEAALRQLANYPESEIGRRVVVMWKDLSPQTRRYASDLLLYIEVHHDALLTGLENGTINIGEMNFDLERRRTLLWWTDNERTKQRAQKLFSDAGVNNRQEAINKMKPALSIKGSVINGAKVFEAVCGNCHVHGNKGKEVGPVLTEIYRKSKETILHDILDPNAAVEPKYIHHRLQTIDGVVHMGIVSAETDQFITMMKIGGEKVTVNKTEVKSFRSLGSSLMMTGLESSMSVQEMANLLEFLQKRN